MRDEHLAAMICPVWKVYAAWKDEHPFVLLTSEEEDDEYTSCSATTKSIDPSS